MWFHSLLTSRKSGPSRSRRAQRRPAHTGRRFALEPLETRIALSLSTLASFGGLAAGSLPVSDLIMDSSGNLYGEATGGGASLDGTIFELRMAAVRPSPWPRSTDRRVQPRRAPRAP